MAPLAALRNFLASATEMSSALRDRHPTNQGYPAVPPTLNAGDHEMRDYYDADHSRVVPNTLPYYTPYLGLRARLSQVWINRWTILLALIICRLLLSISDINYSLARAKEEALSACTSVENVGSAMASMPHYLSRGVNALASDGVTKSVNALMKMLMLTVTGVEEIILFIINMMTSTYVCLITLVVSGSLRAAIDMIGKVGDFMNKTIGELTSEISSDVKGFQDTLNGFLGSIDIPSLFGGSQDPPKIDITSKLDQLNHITIDPTQMNAELAKLNSSIPTFDQVRNFTDNVIRTPFEFVKTAINDSLVGYKFDESVFDVAPKQALTFCSDNTAINDFFDGLAKTVSKAKTIGLIVLTILAVLICVPMAYREIWRWRKQQQRATLLQKGSFDSMDVIYISSRPYTTTFGLWLASKFKSTKRQILSRWFVAYATSVPALFVLSLGLAGLFSCLCQWIVLKVIEREVPGLVAEVAGFTDLVVGALNESSKAWAVSANGVITSTNNDINSEVFGWVETSTKAVNDTLNTFTEEMGKELNNVFGGTPLKDPISEVLYCLIGIKIAGFQKAVTWVHDNAHIDFPLFREDVFSLGALTSVTDTTKDDSFLSAPGSVASDEITGAVIKVSNKLQKQIRQEVIISSVIIAVWVLIMLIGLARTIFGMLTTDKTRAEGGPVGYTGDHRGPISPRSPNRQDPARFPEFGSSVPVSSVGIDDNTWARGAVVDEKVHHTGHRSVEANTKAGHLRSSSYGYVDEKH
ncbi:putative plasma membrane fusion protein prm1 [Bisporella sp. PMI_857]|nr:putative plasma membrane fusion protein prm1 [Bisporella sp. PMI_857]